MKEMRRKLKTKKKTEITRRFGISLFEDEVDDADEHDNIEGEAATEKDYNSNATSES